jgi:hypothetical protein
MFAENKLAKIALLLNFSKCGISCDIHEEQITCVPTRRNIR